MIYLISNNTELYDRPANSGIKMCTIDESLAFLSGLNVIGADTETTGLLEHESRLLTLQLGNFDHQVVIDVQSVGLEPYRNLLENKDITYIWHNAQFDLKFMFKHKVFTPKVFDTMLAEHVLHRGMKGHSAALDSVVYKYMGVMLDKGVRGEIHRQGLTDRVIRYAADDVKYLEKVMNVQKDLLERQDLSTYMGLENKYVIPLAYMAHCGFYLDGKQWLKKCEEDELRMDELTKVLDDYVIEHHSDSMFVDHQLSLFEDGLRCAIQWGSSQQVVKFFNYLGMDTKVFDKGIKKDSVEIKHIKKYIDDYEIIGPYVEYKQQDKLITTYGRNFLDFISNRSGRVHTVYRQILDTGRTSSGQKAKYPGDVSFPNLQNVPKDPRHRHSFKAQRPDTSLVVGDYSQQEQIILANVSQEPALIEFFTKGDGGDMHSYNAKQMFPELKDLSLSEIKKNHPDLRQNAKSVGFAINYGGNGFTIAVNGNMSIEEGNRLYEAYFKAFPKLREYFTKVQNKSLADGYITVNTVSGSKSYYQNHGDYLNQKSEFDSEFWDLYRVEKEKDSDMFQTELKPKVRKFFTMVGKMKRDALNYPIQGTAAEMTKLAMIYFFWELVERGWIYDVLLCNMVHDEIVAESPVNIVNEARDVLQECMERSSAVFCKTIQVKANPEITKIWTH